MIEIVLYTLLGLLLGIILGLIPGIHPNMIALLLPFIAAFNIAPANLVAFAISLAVSNTFLDFIPSMLLGAPEAGKELTALPAHRLLLQGNGYDAVKLAVIGGLGSVIFLIAAMPLIIIGLPALYGLLKPFTYALLIFITLVIIFSEEKFKGKTLAVFCFLAAGFVGILSDGLNADSTLLLFPILSGLFGVSTLVLSKNTKISVHGKKKEIFLTTRQRNRAVAFGSIGGIFSGMLPGVGASEIATMTSADKNEKSFIMTVGAVTIANTIMAMLTIWLISKPRSGIAVFVDQLVAVGWNDFLLMVAVSVFVAGLSAVITLRLAKRFVNKIEGTNYGMMNKLVIGLIVAMTIIFTGAYGVLLLVTCTALGIFTNLAGVRRSVLMGVLILPTIIFYLPI